MSDFYYDGHRHDVKLAGKMGRVLGLGAAAAFVREEYRDAFSKGEDELVDIIRKAPIGEG